MSSSHQPESVCSLRHLYDRQVEFQRLVLKKLESEQGRQAVQIPSDDVFWFSYHIQAMTEELGEVLKADKRWKTHRNTAFDPKEKADEIADVFITAINIAIYSGLSVDDLFDSIFNKIMENSFKITKEV